MWTYLPLLFATLFGFTAPGLARELPPHIATWMLSAGGLLAAAGSSSALAMVVFDAVARNPDVAARARWSTEVLRHDDPITTPAGIVATVMVLVFAAAQFLSAAARRTSAILAAHRLAAELPGTGSELSVLRSPQRQAFAVPGRPGRIAVTTGMLRALNPQQRRVVLAHERSHLGHHHHLHHSAVHLAAAGNPLLHRLRGAVETATATERWADEDAAAVCPRDTVAATLIQAATGTNLRVPAAVLGVARNDVLARVAALRAPAPTLTFWRIGLPSALLLATTVAVAVAMRDTERLFELAKNTYRPGGH